MARETKADSSGRVYIGSDHADREATVHEIDGKDGYLVVFQDEQADN